jgi:signal transduction histidine kinase/CheY-like chemotaxis protein
MRAETPADVHLAGIGTVDTKPLVVLLVEDNPPDAELIAIRLEPGPYGTGSMPVRVIQRGTAATACAALHYWPVDVVILDLTLPDASGLEALHRIRAASRGTPVIVLSGLADQALAIEAIRAGAQDYVLKPPPDGPTLARILRYACERHRLIQTLDSARALSAIAARQWKLLAEVGKVLAASTDPTQAIPQVSKLVVPDVADCFVLFLARDEEMPLAGELWCTYGEIAPALRDSVRSLLNGDESDANGLLARLSANPGENATAWDEALLPVYASLGLASGSGVPLRFGGRLRGLLILAFTPGRRDSGADVEFTRAIAYSISMALEQNRLLRQTQRAVAARDWALSTVSHDLRSPLSTIQICANALIDPEPAPPSGIREMGGLIGRSVAWMQQIVDDLLDSASLDANNLVLHRRPTSIGDLFDTSRELFARVANERAIKLIFEPPEDLPQVDADPSRLMQVFANLISNAIKFTPRGGRVELSAERVDDQLAAALLAGKQGPAVRFTVSDTGSGIPAEDLTHVFERYWQSPAKRHDGAGLGLAIAKGLVEAHDSHLNVESVVGRGSKFWFTLPITESAVLNYSSNGASLT